MDVGLSRSLFFPLVIAPAQQILQVIMELTTLLRKWMYVY